MLIYYVIYGTDLIAFNSTKALNYKEISKYLDNIIKKYY